MKVEIDLNELYSSEGDSVEEIIKESVINEVADRITDRIIEDVNKDVLEVINARIGDKLNEYMENFFETKRKITDAYGDVIDNKSVKEVLKQRCDDFMNCLVDKDGKPNNSWGSKKRVEYIAEKCVDYKIESAIRDACDKAVTTIKKQANDYANGKLGNALAKSIGMDGLFDLSVKEQKNGKGK